MEGKQLELFNSRQFEKKQIGRWDFWEGYYINVNRLIEYILWDVVSCLHLWNYLKWICKKSIRVSCRWKEYVPKSINKGRCEHYRGKCSLTIAQCNYEGEKYILEFLLPEWLWRDPISKITTIIHELFHVPYLESSYGKGIIDHNIAFYTNIGYMLQKYLTVMNPRLKAALHLLDGEKRFVLECHNACGMQLKQTVSKKAIERSYYAAITRELNEELKVRKRISERDKKIAELYRSKDVKMFQADGYSAQDMEELFDYDEAEVKELLKRYGKKSERLIDASIKRLEAANRKDGEKIGLKDEPYQDPFPLLTWQLTSRAEEDDIPF